MSRIDYAGLEEEFGITDFPTRWLMHDGRWLNYDLDHRHVCNWVRSGDWKEFITDGNMSLAYDPHCKFLWIRHCGHITWDQQRALADAIINGYLQINTLMVMVWSEDGDDTFTISGEHLCMMYLDCPRDYFNYVQELEESEV